MEEPMKFLFIAFLIPSLCFAFSKTKQQDCSSIDLKNEDMGATRNQKDVAWCYAFSAADMLGYHYHSSERISAADVAIAYNETDLGKLVRWLNVNIVDPKDAELKKIAHQTGFNKVALSHYMSQGWCPERVFPSESWTKITNDKKSQQVPLAQAMLEISALHDIRTSLTAENLPYYYQFKNVNAETFISLLQTKALSNFYSSLRRQVCQNDRVEFSEKRPVRMIIRHQGIFKHLSRQLELGNPVGLDYDSRILENSAHRGLKISELHTSVIVGRRWNTKANTCEFQIRNSWGQDCSKRYDSTYECNEGYIWLSESKIFPSMTSLVYIE
jgi:hypothetical protein